MLAGYLRGYAATIPDADLERAEQQDVPQSAQPIRGHENLAESNQETILSLRDSKVFHRFREYA